MPTHRSFRGFGFLTILGRPEAIVTFRAGAADQSPRGLCLADGELGPPWSSIARATVNTLIASGAPFGL
jgi:hypothetical protein